MNHLENCKDEVAAYLARITVPEFGMLKVCCPGALARWMHGWRVGCLLSSSAHTRLTCASCMLLLCGTGTQPVFLTTPTQSLCFVCTNGMLVSPSVGEEMGGRVSDT